MSNLLKNILLGFTFVCLIALVVFCIQIIVLNRGVDPITPGSIVSGGIQQGDEDPDATGDGSSDDGNGEGTGGEEGMLDMPVTPRPLPQGERHSWLVTENNRLIIYVRDDLFEFEQRDRDWWFLYTGGGVATLEITFTLVPLIGIAQHIETLLNEYSGSTRAEFTGEELIQNSELRGFHASVNHGGEMYEIWLHNLMDSDLSLVFLINYANDHQREALYEALSSLSIE